MPSYTKEQKERALAMLEECDGSVTLAMRRIGYPSRQTFYRWPDHAAAFNALDQARPRATA